MAENVPPPNANNAVVVLAEGDLVAQVIPLPT
jgi:hypothetical protein